MKHNYQEELTQSVERFRATMEAYQGSMDTGAGIVEKGRTLLVVRGERSELRVLDRVCK